MLEFVIVGASGRAASTDRSRIRSKAAQDKNKRTNSRRSIREAKKLATQDKKNENVPQLPRAPPHDLELATFAEPLTTEHLVLVYKIMQLKTVENGRTAMERCIDFNIWDISCMHWMFHDAAFLHSMLTSAVMMDDAHRLVAQQPGDKMWYHLQKSISILNQRLREEKAYLEDSLVNTILALATLSCIFGDYTAAEAHLSGLTKVIQLRGGFQFLHEHPMLHFRINQMDLTWTLVTGKRAIFLPPSAFWTPLFSNPQAETSHVSKPSFSRFIRDERLYYVFQDMQQAVSILNGGVFSKHHIDGSTFQPILHSIQTRLLHLGGKGLDSFSESLRLTMLAYLFRSMTLPALNLPTVYLQNCLERSWKCAQQEEKADTERLPLEFWMTIVAEMVFCGTCKDLLTERFVGAVKDAAPSWDKAQEILGQVMWIDSVHNGKGQKIYRRLFGPLLL